MKPLIQIVMILSFLILAAAAGYAETNSLRCGTRIISVNDSRLRVLEHCGEPLFAEMTGASWKRLDSGGRALKNVAVGEVKFVDKWTYSKSNVYYRIVFFGDTVQRIEAEYR